MVNFADVTYWTPGGMDTFNADPIFVSDVLLTFLGDVSHVSTCKTLCLNIILLKYVSYHYQDTCWGRN